MLILFAALLPVAEAAAALDDAATADDSAGVDGVAVSLALASELGAALGLATT
jgi:hypothetical protein